MTGMHSGNWGNGSGYDANMGENMNLEEIGSVLRWHEANGTYPARTIKATLYDNEEGGLVGSGFYSAAGTPAAIVVAPTAVGDTNIKVTSDHEPRRGHHDRARRGRHREPDGGVGRHGRDEHDPVGSSRRGRHEDLRRQRQRLRRRPQRERRPRDRRHEQRRCGRHRPADGDDARRCRSRGRHEHQGRLGDEHGRRREGRGGRRLRQRGVPARSPLSAPPARPARASRSTRRSRARTRAGTRSRTSGAASR